MYDSYDFVVVGAGLYGSTISERLATAGKKVLLVEKRDHIGGNCYDEYDEETGILFHTYGPHIFHANDDDVIAYLQKFTAFTGYFHQVLTNFKDKIYQMPINLETINSFYNLNLRPFEMDNFLKKECEKEGISNPQNMEEKAISLIGRPLYEAFFREYTIKQWGVDPKELSESIINRIPIRNNYYESYYSKKFQGLPIGGYTAIFEKMLAHPNITVQLETDFFEIKKDIPESCHVVYSGPIDAYFDYEIGKLEYRTITFQKEVQPHRDWQGTSVVNYPELKHPFTRICEPRHFYCEKWEDYSKEKTIIFKEFSSLDNGTAPFYPIKNKRNDELAAKYREKASATKNVTFGGRLGEYQYYDMDSVLSVALKVSLELGGAPVSR